MSVAVSTACEAVREPETGVCAIADKTLIAREFGGASKTYDGASRLQRLMGDVMLETLASGGDSLQGCQVLDLGCGTGWFARKMAANWGVRVTGVDLSPGMIQQAANASEPDIAWQVADAESLPFKDNRFDVVFSNLMVQWCADPRKVFAECQRVLRPGGRLVLSTLLEGTLRELEQAWAMADPGQQHINRFESRELLQQRADAVLPGARVDSRTVQLPYASPMALAAELRQLGAGFKSASRRKTVTAPGRLRAMCRHYPTQADGRVIASYEAAWVYWQRS